jgi:glycosidase
VRLATQLQNKQDLLRIAASILLTLPGSPFLYYGEEIGIRNGTTSGDESKRTPMPWDNQPGGGFTNARSPWFPFSPGREFANVASQIANPNSLLSHYRNLIRTRKASPALTNGQIQLLTPSTGRSPVLAFLRTNADERIFVAHNLSSSFAVAGPYPITAISAERLYLDGSSVDPSGSSGNWTVPLPPHSTGIWRMR